MTDVCRKVYDLTADGAAVCFMQAEKNTEHTGGRLQLPEPAHLDEEQSGVPSTHRYRKQY